MTRMRANQLLLLTAFLWGMAFVAQKTGMDGLGPAGFTGIRFLLAALVILPLVLREWRQEKSPPMSRKHKYGAALLGVIFFLAVVLQQAGMMTTTVSNAGFLTGLYVIFVPFFAWMLFRRPPARIVWPSCLLAFAGVWLLSGGAPAQFTTGDWLVLASALLYGVQIPLVGFLAQGTGRPFTLALVQYAACVVLGLVVAVAFEPLSLAGIQNNLIQILYAGVISGGIAYTIQIVAQQYTAPSHAAIIMLMEAPFAALAGAVLLGERLGAWGLAGCGLIFAAALLAESGGLFIRKKPAM